MKPLITLFAILILGIGAKAQRKASNILKLDTACFAPVDTTTLILTQLQIGYTSRLTDSLVAGNLNIVDTVFTITYCLNTVTLETKWIRLKALSGFNYQYVSFNHLLYIYNKYLNVPKNYKPIYSVNQ